MEIVKTQTGIEVVANFLIFGFTSELYFSVFHITLFITVRSLVPFSALRSNARDERE